MINTSTVTQIISLFAEVDSELCINQGRVWATVGAAGDDIANDYGDHFLSVGQKLSILKGQNLVFESMQADMPVLFYFTAVYACYLASSRCFYCLNRY